MRMMDLYKDTFYQRKENVHMRTSSCKTDIHDIRIGKHAYVQYVVARVAVRLTPDGA